MKFMCEMIYMQRNPQYVQDILFTIENITKRYGDAGYFPMAEVRVFDTNGTIAVTNYGGIEEGTLFDVASCSKIATATQILRLIDRGELNLQDKVTDLFPEISANEYMCERLAGVTLYQLLTHTSTIDEWYPFYANRPDSFYEVLEYALKHTNRIEGMLYSDINFMLLGKLLEIKKGLPLKDCLQEELVKPLGLGNMMYCPPEGTPVVPSCYGNPIETGMCAERNISFDGFRPLGVPVYGTANDGNAHYYFDDVAGHAGVFASAEAYEKLCRYYMTTDQSVLVEAQKEQTGAPTRGLGLQTGSMYPCGCGHTGFTGTCIYFSREKNIGVVAFTNRLFYKERNRNMTNDYRRALIEAVFSITEAYRKH